MGLALTETTKNLRAATFVMRMSWVIACAGALSACSTVPTQGPSRQSVIDGGQQINAPYLLVQLSDFIIQKLAHFPGPSLYGRFGDYRGAVEQRIGVGDTIEVTIFEAAGGGLFSQPVMSATSTGSHSAQIPAQVVQRDGSITVPYAGRVSVVGQTTPEVEKTIVDRLTGKAIEPQAIVTLSKNVSTSVTVGGEAIRGARVPLTARGDHLLDVIATAGGITAPANESFIELTRGGKTVRVPFQTLIADPKENIFARPGDTLTIVRYPLSFTAAGATGRNSVVPFDAVGISLEEAIGKAAGLLDNQADPEGVFVLRYEPIAVVRDFPGLTPQQAALNLVPVAYIINMRDPASLFIARRFSVHDKDIVYVSNSPFNDLQKVLGLVGTLTSPAISAVGASATAGVKF
jgi:polysaccharide export outer membrane protein